jgi:hypothetical protein
MPHQIFLIDELMRLVVEEVIETSPQTAVSFALTCRMFMEPTLKLLWKRQCSLINLLMVLSSCPPVVHGFYKDELAWMDAWRLVSTFRDLLRIVLISTCLIPQEIRDVVSKEDWDSFQRYASWMCELNLSVTSNRTIPTDDTLTLLLSNSPGGLMLPNLERLTWNITDMPTLLTVFPLFLSPGLKHVTLYTHPEFKLHDDELENLVKMISLFPPSLEHLSVMYYRHTQDCSLQDAISSLVLRCGPSLRSFETCRVLSEAAIHHLIQLPRLSSLRICQGPPRAIPTSILPSLEHLQLDTPRGSPLGQKSEALPWSKVIISHKRRILENGSRLPTPTTNAVDLLKSLKYPQNTIVDSGFLSSVVNFRNLVTLCVDMICFYGQCSFHLTDNDLRILATTLPLLKCLRLGKSCLLDTCETTVVSLALLSVHCPDLEVLESHFNTKEITSDMQRLLDNRDAYDGPKCKVRDVILGHPARWPDRGWANHGEDYEILLKGFKFIFPDMVDLEDSWTPLRRLHVENFI